MMITDSNAESAFSATKLPKPLRQTRSSRLAHIMNKAFCNFIAIIVYRQKLFPPRKQCFIWARETQIASELELVSFICAFMHTQFAKHFFLSPSPYGRAEQINARMHDNLWDTIFSVLLQIAICNCRFYFVCLSLMCSSIEQSSTYFYDFLLAFVH
jgi:hypothetical protein